MVDEQDPKSSTSASHVRQTILLALLALAVVALVYEYGVARPKSLAAWDAVSELLNSNYDQPGEVTNTNETVQAAIGKPPARTRTEDEGKKRVEIYEWRRGIPILVYSFLVFYDNKEDGRILLNAALAERLPSRREKNLAQ